MGNESDHRRNDPRSHAKRRACGFGGRALVLYFCCAPLALDPVWADRCRENADPHWRAERGRALDAEDAQYFDGTLSRFPGAVMSSLSTRVEIMAPRNQSAAVGKVREMLQRADTHLAAIEATTSVPGSLTVSLLDYPAPISRPATTENPTPSRVYGWQWCEPGTRKCQLTAFRDAWAGPETDFLHVLAHEFFHVAQKLVTPDVSDCRAAWWVEGTADWFANRVVHGSTWSESYLRDFDRMSNHVSLLEMTYESLAFFFWAGEVYGETFPMSLGHFGDAGLNDERRVGQSLPPADWQKFLQAYLNGELRYPDGRPAIPDPSLGPYLPQPWQLRAPPLTFARGQLELSGGTWEIPVSGTARYVGLRDEGSTSWDIQATRPPGRFTREVPCTGAHTAVVAAVSVDGEPLRVTLGAEEIVPCRCTQPVPRDHCMIGTWRATSTDAPTRYNQGQAVAGGPSRWVGQRMGDNEITLRANGTFEQVFRGGTRSDFEHRTPPGARMDQRVTLENSAQGRWSSPSDGHIEMCRDHFEGEMTNRLSIGPAAASRTMPIPHDPVAEKLGFDLVYVCEGDQADISLVLDGQPFVSWTAQRVRPAASPPSRGPTPP